MTVILKLGMQHEGLELYKVYINDDHGLPLTYFMARSNVLTCFPIGKSKNNGFFRNTIADLT